MEIKEDTKKFFYDFFGISYAQIGDGKKICEFAEAYLKKQESSKQ